ncbi:hypothetical protein QQF64_006973 [Cirrhinus molitorella]|uniref:Uncharacterized protein n=1 Tax=Cirrhinus molitorella TaxID=172907 RepID=A0ABR3MDE3_9TELE
MQLWRTVTRNPPQTRSQQRRTDRSALIVPDELFHFPANARAPVCDWEGARNGGKFLPPWRCHFPTLQLAACQTHRTLTRGGVDSKRRGGASASHWMDGQMDPQQNGSSATEEVSKHDDYGNESSPFDFYTKIEFIR